ncbi:MAG: hypothetical protein ABI459_05750 [Deltaproteobacteria bacterium]
MKTIVLFHRLELTELFASMCGTLDGRCHIVHLAYSDEELARLRRMGVTGQITVFKDEVRRLYQNTSPDPRTLNEIDALFLRGSSGAFNLNAAIQSDRGFSLLSLEEAQRLTVAYHRFWCDFLELHQADAVVHETCSLMLNFVAAMVCAQRGAHYLYAIMALGPEKGFNHMLMSGFDFTCPDLDRALSAIASRELPVDAQRCIRFLTDFRQNYAVFLGSAFKRPSLARLAALTLLNSARQRLKGNRHDRILDNIDHWQNRQRRTAQKLGNLIRYRREIEFERIVPGERYYFYPLHLEPEAVVLYHAHGLYTNQVKLIQNIAAQLPPGVMLYVKDHPHDHGYRSVEDYHAIKSVPNIRLLDASVPGKEVINQSLGVVTLTGTAGFEALLMGKQVFTFGKCFYSPGAGVVYLRNIRDLREAFYDAQIRLPIADEALYGYLTAYFASLHPGLTDYFGGRAQRYGIDIVKNSAIVAEGMLATLGADV